MWCFMATDTPDEYTIKTYKKYKVADFATERVRFHDHSGTGLALPNPKYLALHAALTKVMHATDAGYMFARCLSRLDGASSHSSKTRTGSDFRILVSMADAFEETL
jgi:phosphatidylserine/phosphatidylglycerophosphate/cardiolipin synthase-like enzyme